MLCKNLFCISYSFFYNICTGKIPPFRISPPGAKAAAACCKLMHHEVSAHDTFLMFHMLYKNKNIDVLKYSIFCNTHTYLYYIYMYMYMYVCVCIYIYIYI